MHETGRPGVAVTTETTLVEENVNVGAWADFDDGKEGTRKEEPIILCGLKSGEKYVAEMEVLAMREL